MINITSADGVITIVITDSEARELQKACRHYVDQVATNSRHNNHWLSARELALVAAFTPLREAIIKHV